MLVLRFVPADLQTLQIVARLESMDLEEMVIE
jgi:hypothetical protein